MRYRRSARQLRKLMASGSGASADPSRSARSDHPLLLRSSDPALYFDVKLSVEFTWTGTGPAPLTAGDIAVRGVARRAEEVSKLRALTECERLRAELNIALLHWEPVAMTGVHARAHCVSVEADPELIAGVAAREETIRRRTVLSWQREQREDEVRWLGSLITDPLRATAWWFADNLDKPDQLVKVAQDFQLLRTTLEPEQSDSAGRLVDEFLDDADKAERMWLLETLLNAFGTYGRSDLADRLRTRYGGSIASADDEPAAS
ncbi:hypothetical protein GCM10011581_24300 [Saccharopolyspora subtropica]|uniref:Uncharacterized protein n=1 Tax=Saccharopolyspora thermophila TaxID=89367 RepID=A0A917NBR7_9PSEU|nr:hypothetical protein [Saccharopolyspora subtropica]GGI86341.1 hypothetical protein GCM10011581_24300 [Saccharopolyspora subtropica]